MDLDDISNTTTNRDNNRGYYSYVITGSAISTIYLFYLLISKCCEKSCCNFVGNYVLFHLTLVLQFAVATVMSVFLRNNEEGFKTLEDSKTALENVGQTNTATYQTAGKNIIM